MHILTLSKITTDASMWGWWQSARESNDWCPLVPDGNQLSYQLPRTTGCLSSLTKIILVPLTIYLHMDNKMAIAYLNHKGGTLSPHYAYPILLSLVFDYTQLIPQEQHPRTTTSLLTTESTTNVWPTVGDTPK